MNWGALIWMAQICHSGLELINEAAWGMIVRVEQIRSERGMDTFVISTLDDKAIFVFKMTLDIWVSINPFSVLLVATL